MADGMPGQQHPKRRVSLIFFDAGGGHRNAATALQVEIELGRVCYVSIHDGAGRAVPAPICNVGWWKETNVMTFSNNNDSDRWIYASVLACL